jgi:predicted dehydrogenase
MKKINSAVIGLGVGLHHSLTYIKNKNTVLKYVCDFNQEKLNLFNKHIKIVKLKNDKKIINDNQVSLVSIASYDNYHFNQIKRCLKNNKNIFVEKPLCLSIKELKEIKKLKKKKPFLKISSNLVLRTCGLFKQIKKEVKKEMFGNIYYIEANYLWGRPDKFKGWRSKIPYYSKIFGAAIHMIDLIVWILNEKPIEVFSVGNKLGLNNKTLRFNSFVAMFLKFKNGLIVKITGNGPSVSDHFHELKIYGTTKSFHHTSKETFYQNKNLNIQKIKKIKKLYPDKEKRSDVLNSFIRHLSNNKSKPIVKEKDVYDIMSICLAAEKSMNLEKKIIIKYF